MRENVTQIGCTPKLDDDQAKHYKRVHSYK